MLLTTVFNYKELSKLYKEQTTLGYSKFLPQVALGISQSSILANAYFENEVLNITELLVPAQSSNTQSSSGNSQKLLVQIVKVIQQVEKNWQMIKRVQKRFRIKNL